MPERHVVDTFVSLVENGRFIEALQRYYHPAAVVWENRQTSRSGLDVLIENEQRVLNAFTAVEGRALQVMVDGDRYAVVAQRITSKTIMDEERVPEWL